MQHRVDRAVEFARLQRREKVALVDVIGDLAVGQIAELVALGQIVHGDDVGLAALVQRPDQIGADESGRAGDDDVHAHCFYAPTSCCRCSSSRIAPRPCPACRPRCRRRGWRPASRRAAAPAPSMTRERRDHRVAGAAHVEHLARLRRLVLHAAVLEQGHALLAARHEQRLQAEFAPQCLRPLRQVVFARPAPDHFAQLGAIRA